VKSSFARSSLRAILVAAAPFALSSCVTVMTTARMTSPRADLRHEIDSLTSQPEFRSGQWGVLIVNPRTGDTLYSKNAGKLFMPASNMKIITSAAAMTLLGPD
jgi:serine-type D-Ala-D-Ala carboxypeptidase/endopeptidase (penicillin-binding protein 4)